MKPLASLSLDLDNQWSYMKTHGDPGWERFPSYLDRLVPLALDLLARLDLRCTFFVRQPGRLSRREPRSARRDPQGRARDRESQLPSRAVASRTPERVAEVLALEKPSRPPPGFEPRASGTRLQRLHHGADRARRARLPLRRSTLPTWIGPIARAYYFMTARLEREEAEDRAALFGGVRDALRPIKPYHWQLGETKLLGSRHHHAVRAGADAPLLRALSVGVFRVTRLELLR
jgi:hypothetical protein